MMALSSCYYYWTALLMVLEVEAVELVAVEAAVVVLFLLMILGTAK